MALSLRLAWHQPIPIREGHADEKLFWMCDALDKIPTEPGAYIFARVFGGACLPLYIGQAENIQKRVFGHDPRPKRMAEDPRPRASPPTGARDR